MSEHIICDKCKSEIESSENVRAVKGRIVLEYSNEETHTTFLDLCENCYNKVIEFIKK